MLTIQFGQCGNQLGHALQSKIAQDIAVKQHGIAKQSNYNYIEQSFERWYDVDAKDSRVARTILVDTESKVVKKLLKDTNNQNWSYSKRNIICQSDGGSANNWAFGYNVKGSTYGNLTLEAVRRELEKTDQLEGILLLLSAAGGTGSGVGSRTCELLREEFPTKDIVSAIVLPFASGEVGTQNYNALLTLAKFTEDSDLVLLFGNDHIYSMCSGLLGNNNSQINDLNDLISQKLCSVFQPAQSNENSLHNLVSSLATHPCYKLSTIKSTPHVPIASSNYECYSKWTAYIRHLKQTLRMSNSINGITDAETRNPTKSNSSSANGRISYCTSVSNYLISRGTTNETTTSNNNDPIRCDELQEDDTLYCEWISRNDRFNKAHEQRRFLGQEKFLSLITNNSQMQRPVDVIVEKAWNGYIHTAFLHQYKRFGLEDEDFLRAFATCENIVKGYKELDQS